MPSSTLAHHHFICRDARFHTSRVWGPTISRPEQASCRPHSARLPGSTIPVTYAVNACNDVAGSVFNGSNLAALWKDGQAFDLNSYLPPGSGWTLSEANGINDFGQVIGAGTVNGNDHGFLLTPSVVARRRDNPLPVITRLNPDVMPLRAGGAAGTDFIVEGHDFVPTSRVHVDLYRPPAPLLSHDLTSIPRSNTSLTAHLDPADLLRPAVGKVTVVNPARAAGYRT